MLITRQGHVNRRAELRWGKTTASGLVLLALAAAAVGIGVVSQQPAQAATTITFWHDWGGQGGQIIEGIVNQFNKSQSEVQVKTVLTNDQGRS